MNIKINDHFSCFSVMPYSSFAYNHLSIIGYAPMMDLPLPACLN
jgi:hypothetical protein